MLFLFGVVLAVVHVNAINVPPARNGEQNEYYLYNTEVPRGIAIQPSNFVNSTSVPEFVTGRQTIVLVHGHGGDAFSSLNPAVRVAYLEREEDVNIIVVDWSTYTKWSYSTAVSAAPSVGAKLGEFLGSLAENSRITLANLHLIGFNIGAHVVGFAGRTLGGQVARITGLDPAGNQWGSNSRRLTSTDAVYVEVIHSDGDGILANGLGTAIGHVDIFLNGGSNQPGCLTHACSHNRAWEVFAATLVRGEPMYGYPCSSNLQMVLNRCSGSIPVVVGDAVLFKNGEGIYRANTRRSYPY